MKWTRRFRKMLPSECDVRERVNPLGLGMLLLLLFAVGFAYAYPRLTPHVRHDFDARVLEKYVAVGESRIGSATLPRLVVETADGRRFTISVNDEQYERARVGMWLSRRNSELTLSWDEPGPTPPVDDGNKVESR